MSCLFFQVSFLCSPVTDAFPSQRCPWFSSLCQVWETQLTERKIKGVRKRWKEGVEEGQTETEREERRREKETEKHLYSMNNICSFCYLEDPHSS